METGYLLEDRYRIIKVLGSGGMSRVYLAENLKLGTLWAIKQVPRNNPSQLDLLAEPNILKKLEHPALPKVYDVLEDEENYYVIEDYIDGTPLNKKLAEEGGIPEDRVLLWAVQICDVLEYLHTFEPNPIIYRDMKPSNIILTGTGNIKLVDFGIAREYKPGIEGDTVYIGTVGYAAPEQYGNGQSTVATDIYSLGITMHELVTGKSPNDLVFDTMGTSEQLIEVSTGLEQVIRRCTRKNPAHRYQSAAELKKEIIKIQRKDSLHKDSAADKSCDPDNRPHMCFKGFKKLVLAIWDNAEFGCELAYLAAKLSGMRVLLIDADLLSPKADLFLKTRKSPSGFTANIPVGSTGLNIVMDAVVKGRLNESVIEAAAVKRRELSNLFILTGSYRLDDYEYFSDESLIKLIEKAYRAFDLTIILVNKSIYDSYTVVSMTMADHIIAALRADLDALREFNRYCVFLNEKQQIPLERTKFIAFENERGVNLDRTSLDELTGQNYLGAIRFSRKRRKYRNLKPPYVKRMEREVKEEYSILLSAFGILPRRKLSDKIKSSMTLMVGACSYLFRTAGRLVKSKKAIERRVAG